MLQPVLHANSRQELCEYCPYFNSYQSGVYAQDGKCRGFLIDAFASYGDVFTPWAFVSHAGGKAKPKTGAPSNESSDFRLSQQFQLSESQDLEDRSVKSMKLAMDESRPVVVIMGSSFNILGSYLIRACWATKEYYSNPNDQHQPPSRSYHIRYKFLFQWIASEHQSNWFHNVQYPTPIPPPPKFQCPTCCHDSLHVYVTRNVKNSIFLNQQIFPYIVQIFFNLGYCLPNAH
ncbi:hypothetical protein HDU79_009204 [Rhizoclosmatium sp. JEL0117]|nr:hypothetical protein HDU79_009204 [Rhizoclosmatium sp. JEL0117]